MGDLRLGANSAQRQLGLPEPAPGLELIAAAALQASQGCVVVGRTKERLGLLVNRQHRVSWPLDAVEQTVGFQAVPREPALSHPLRNRDSAPDDRDGRGVAADAD